MTNNGVLILKSIKERQDGNEWVSGYADLETDTGLPHPILKIEVKALRTQGMIELVRAFTDDGFLCGSGYYITLKGRVELDAHE